MNTIGRAIGLAVIGMSASTAYAEPKDPAQNDIFDAASKAITETIMKPMNQNMSDRLMREFAKNGGSWAPGAKAYLEKRKIEEQIAYDDETKRRNAVIAESKRCKQNCQPRPLQECLKPNYTIDDDVIECSKGLIIKNW